MFGLALTGAYVVDRPRHILDGGFKVGDGVLRTGAEADLLAEGLQSAPGPPRLRAIRDQ